MLLTEVFENTKVPVSDPTLPVIKIPLKLITVTAEKMAELTNRKKKQVGVLASQMMHGKVTDTGAIQVKKVDRGFILTKGLLRFLAYQRAGMYAIPATVIQDDVLEDRERFIIYMNDKPTAYFASKADADAQAEIVKKKQPSAKIEVKPGIVKHNN